MGAMGTGYFASKTAVSVWVGFKSRTDYGAGYELLDHGEITDNKTAGRWLVEIGNLPEWIGVVNSAP